jgi:hypothetical protein
LSSEPESLDSSFKGSSFDLAFDDFSYVGSPATGSGFLVVSSFALRGELLTYSFFVSSFND